MIQKRKMGEFDFILLQITGDVHVRYKNSDTSWIPTNITEEGIQIGLGALTSYQMLQDYFEYSVDGGKSWRPCEVSY